MADAIRNGPETWHLHGDIDADGLSAVTVMREALRVIGKTVTTSVSRDKTEASYEGVFHFDAEAFLFLDKGSNQAVEIQRIAQSRGVWAGIIDHHGVPEQADVPMVNPRLCGLDGSLDASAGTTAAAVALYLGLPLRVAVLGLVGAIGDWQHMSGWRGWNRELIKRGLEEKVLHKQTQLRLIGVSVAEALDRSGWIDDEPESGKEFLEKHGLPLVGDVDSLGPHEATLRKALNAIGATDLDHEVVVHNGMDLRRIFRVVDACGREGHPQVGMDFLLDRIPEAESHFDRYAEAIGDNLEALRREGTRRLRAVQHFHASKAAYTGMVGGIAMTHALPDKSVPICVTAEKGSMLQVSTRGNKAMIEAGMNLGDAVSAAAQNVDAEGGGHTIAAGAVIPKDLLEPFLQALDEALMKQGWMERL